LKEVWFGRAIMQSLQWHGSHSVQCQPTLLPSCLPYVRISLGFSGTHLKQRSHFTPCGMAAVSPLDFHVSLNLMLSPFSDSLWRFLNSGYHFQLVLLCIIVTLMWRSATLPT
jgi:hypothetical protein